MCEINPKRKRLFDLEFFTSQDITDEQWENLVIKRLLFLEETFNEKGEIRVHIHEKEAF